MNLTPQPSLEPTVLSTSPSNPVPGFWLRALGFGIDLVALSIAFFYLVRFGYDSLFRLGDWSMALGFAISVAYFCIGNSTLTGGQTLGRRMLNLRLISSRGSEPSPGQAVARALFSQALIIAYLFALRILTGHPMLLAFTPEISFLISLVAGFAALGFALATAVFCGLHPKKQSLQDLVAGTIVARDGREAEARKFLDNWTEMERGKRKLAIYPTVIAGAIFLLLMVTSLNDALPRLREQIPPLREARTLLSQPGIQLDYMVGPSRAARERYEQYMEQRERIAAERGTTDALSTDTLRHTYTGSEMHYIFRCTDRFTSASLTADDRYSYLMDRIIPVSRDLLSRSFVDESGNVEPCEAIQMEFIEAVPFYIYTRFRVLWREVIPLESHDSFRAIQDEPQSEIDTP